MIEEMVDGKRHALYGWDGQGLISRVAADGRSLFYLHDGLGSTIALLDQDGRLAQSYEYSAFGECLSGKDAVNQFRFVGGFGGQKDDDTGSVYFWNRWYDPQVGRWVSEDPIRLAGGDMNYFRYSANRPTNVIDPSSLVWSNERALAHFMGGGGDVTLDDVGAYDIVSRNNQRQRDEWREITRRKAIRVGKSLTCPNGNCRNFADIRAVGASSGVFWIGGYSLTQRSSCQVKKQCPSSCYEFKCILGSSMHDEFRDPLDLDNSHGRDFWDHWNPGTPFFVTGVWSEEIYGSGEQ